MQSVLAHGVEKEAAVHKYLHVYANDSYVPLPALDVFFLPADVKPTIKTFFHRTGFRNHRHRREWNEPALITAGGKKKKIES